MTKAEIPRCPGGWFAGSSQPRSRAGPRGWRGATRSCRRRGSRRCRGPRRRRVAGRGRARASTPWRSCGRPRRRMQGPRSSAPRSRPGRCCARWRSRATRSRRRRRSSRCSGRRWSGRRAILRSTGRAAPTRGGRRSRARRCPCGCRSEAACVTSPPRCRRLFETTDEFQARFSSVAGPDQAPGKPSPAPARHRPPGDGWPASSMTTVSPRWNPTSSWAMT